MKYAIRMIRPHDTEPMNKYWVMTERGAESWSSPDDTISCWGINEAYQCLPSGYPGNCLVEEAPYPPSIKAWIASVKAQQGTP